MATGFEDEKISSELASRLLFSGYIIFRQKNLGIFNNLNKGMLESLGQSAADISGTFFAGSVKFLTELGSYLPVVSSYSLKENRIELRLDGSTRVTVQFTFALNEITVSSDDGDTKREELVGKFPQGRFLESAVLYLIGEELFGHGWNEKLARLQTLKVLPNRLNPDEYVVQPPPDYKVSWPQFLNLSNARHMAIALSYTPAELLKAVNEHVLSENEAGYLRIKDHAPHDGGVPYPLTPEERKERIVGCLIGGAIGDALGYPVEFLSAEKIFSSNPNGLRRFVPSLDANPGVISDDTQMTLFTADALLTWLKTSPSNPRRRSLQDLLVHSYLDWYTTQESFFGEASLGVVGSALLNERWLFARRAPGLTVMAALERAKDSADHYLPFEEAQNSSKGCGSVMRSSPFGLMYDWGLDQIYSEAVKASKITHGHNTAGVSAGALALIIRFVLEGGGLEESVFATLDFIEGHNDGDQGATYDSLLNAVLMSRSAPGNHQEIERIGAGWVAEEALSIAVYAALSYPGKDDIISALSLAVSHSGDSDSTGAICGNILGALHGIENFPQSLVTQVEGRETLSRVGTRLAQEIEKTRENRFA